MPDMDADAFQYVFSDPPERWGLRGDVHVWDAMRARLADAEPVSTPEAAVTRLWTTFREVTGIDLATTAEERVFREEFAHGGMSSGHIHVPTWQDRLMPMLETRARSFFAE